MKYSDVNIIIPAYNESENILLQIKEIRKNLPNVFLLIIDDSSKEEFLRTEKAIKGIRNIEIYSRGKKLGRGSAVIEGFKKAKKNKNVKYFFEMDADLAHDPSQLNRFLTKMKSGEYAMVIGSRYAKGGKVVGIPIYRRLLSKVINFFLSHMLNIKLSDYTSGYRLYSRSAIEFLTKIEIKSTGFITLSEITYKLNKNGFKIGEVPATILKRKYGKSTMGARELTVSLIFILRMKVDEEILPKLNQKKV